MGTGLLRAKLMNARSGEALASGVELALTRADRRQGLLKRDALENDSALILSPCFAVHTAFMRFAIDVVFVDRIGHVTRIVRHLRPWRIAVSFRAYATIEFGAGALDRFDLAVGDRLYLSSESTRRPDPHILSGDDYAAVVSPPRSVSTSPVM
jgi:uncharacterized membrane protein (UPF0127 family)